MSIVKALFFDKLKEFFRVHLHIEIHDIVHNLVTVNHIHYHGNESTPLIEQTNPQTIALNIKAILLSLPSEQQEELREIIQNSVLVEDIPLLEKNSKDRIEDIELKESEDKTKALLDFFRGKIPDDDFAILRAAIYIKKRFNEGAPHSEIYALKGEVMAEYGARGRKINNLLSSGYFESMIMPIYKEMASHPEFTHEEFLERYHLIIEEEAFAIFVQGWMAADELAPKIHKKIKRNLKYGVNFVTIHGIGGECIENIKDILSDIEINYPVIKRKIDENNFIITAKIWFDKNKRMI